MSIKLKIKTQKSINQTNTTTSVRKVAYNTIKVEKNGKIVKSLKFDNALKDWGQIRKVIYEVEGHILTIYLFCGYESVFHKIQLSTLDFEIISHLKLPLCDYPSLNFTFDEKREYIFFVNMHDNLKFYDFKTLVEIPHHITRIPLVSFGIFLDKENICFGNFNGKIYFSNFIKPELSEMNAHSDFIYNLIFVKSLKLLISASLDKQIKIWDLKNLNVLHTINTKTKKRYFMELTGENLVFKKSLTNLEICFSLDLNCLHSSEPLSQLGF